MAIIYTKRWWVEARDIEPVRTALIMADAAHLDSLIVAAVAENKRLAREPSSKVKLAEAINRDYRTLWSATSGRSSPSLNDLQTLAAILHVSPEKLILPVRNRLAAAVRNLDVRVSPQCAEFYANFAIQHVPFSDSPRSPLRSLDVNDYANLQDVEDYVEPKLTKIPLLSKS